VLDRIVFHAMGRDYPLSTLVQKLSVMAPTNSQRNHGKYIRSSSAFSPRPSWPQRARPHDSTFASILVALRLSCCASAKFLFSFFIYFPSTRNNFSRKADILHFC
jgi:hypothetical protein